jgi:acetyltransferase-like isoleucine patch superfamily enzyme
MELPVTYRLYPNVILGEGSVVGDFALIGVPPAGKGAGELETRIGAGANLRSHTVLYAGNIIGVNFTTGHGTLIRELNRIGDNVSIGSHTVIEHRTEIGNRVRIHSGSFIPEFCVLEDDAWIGPGVYFTNVLHPLCPSVPQCIKGPRICRGAKIGAHATVLPSVVVGEMAMVAAGAVVTQNVPARVVVVGNPAHVVKTIDDIKCPWDYIAHPYPPDPRTA